MIIINTDLNPQLKQYMYYRRCIGETKSLISSHLHEQSLALQKIVRAIKEDFNPCEMGSRATTTLPSQSCLIVFI